MRIGFDFDGTITKNPFIFKVLIDSLKINNELYLISGTSIKDKSKLIQELNTFGLSEMDFTCLVLKEESTSDVNIVSEWKKNKIDTLKIRLYFENREETANKIVDLCNVCLFK